MHYFLNTDAAMEVVVPDSPPKAHHFPAEYAGAPTGFKDESNGFFLTGAPLHNARLTENSGQLVAFLTLQAETAFQSGDKSISASSGLATGIAQRTKDTRDPPDSVM